MLPCYVAQLCILMLPHYVAQLMCCSVYASTSKRLGPRVSTSQLGICTSVRSHVLGKWLGCNKSFHVLIDVFGWEFFCPNLTYQFCEVVLMYVDVACIGVLVVKLSTKSRG